jgi:hypothetical protein
MSKPFVYVASPYTKGDPAINTRFQCEIFNQLRDSGFVTPIIPLWSHFQHTLYPRPYEDWTAYDNELIARCDACLRLNVDYPELGYFQSESQGADAEVALFVSQEKPVFYTIDALLDWAADYATLAETVG